ncbi:MAG: hypothetical protein K1X66_05395 [Verrucomicrobiae bacterium]|nr:hypothetical protein [Verrucomicrobiae bacterium]
MTTSAIKELDDLIEKNSHLDIGQMDFQNPATLSKLKGSKKSKAKALPHLLAFQRLYRTVNDPKIAKKLLKKGLGSAADIAALTEKNFVDRYAKTFSGNKEQAARQAHRTARARRAQATLHRIEHIQQTEPHYQASWFRDGTPANEIQFEDLQPASHKDVTKSEARYSALSPMAYFLELKTFKNDNLTGTPKYPFQERRPDVETLGPQISHVEEEVPYLNVVNEALEKQFPKEPYKELAEAPYPFNLPFNLPLTQAHHYLDYLKTDLPTLYQSFVKDIKPEITARDYLKLSTKEYEYLATSVSTPKELNSFYGLKSTDDPVQILSNVNIFLEKTGLTRGELQTLLFQNLHPAEIEAGIAQQFFINAVGKDPKPYIIIAKEEGLEKLKLKTLGSQELKPITPEHLDRLNRFIRLARKIGWSFADLNWVITSSCGDKLDDKKAFEEALTRIAAIKHLQEITQQPLDLLCSFWSDLKSIGLGDKPAFQFEDLFDRTFNSRVAQEHKSYLPQNDKEWLKKLYETAGAKPYTIDHHWKPRLAAALGIDRTDVDRIEEYLNLKPDAPIPTPNLQNLSLLFRYAKISQALNLSVEDFLLLLDLIREDKTLLAYNPFPLFMDRKPTDKIDVHALLKGAAATLSQTIWLIELLIGIVQWLKTENLTVPQLSYLKTGQLHRSVKPLLDQQQRTHLFQQLHHEFQNILVTPHSFESENVTPAQAKQIFDKLLAEKYIDKNGLVLKTEPPYPAIFHNTKWINDRPPISTHGAESLYFNGKDAYIDCGEIDLTNKSFTIECWVKRGKEARNRGDGVLGVGSRSLFLGFITTNNGHYFRFYFVDEVFAEELIDGNWHHWACVYHLDGAKVELSLYLDGKKISSGKSAKPDPINGKLVIGRSSWWPDHTSLLGSIAEVRIWNGVRSDNAIEAYKNRSLVGNEKDLLHYQPLSGIYIKLQTLAKRQAQTLFKGLSTSHHVTSLNLIQTISRIASNKTSDQEIVALVMTPILEGKAPTDPFFDTFQHYVSLFQQLKLGEREAQILFNKPERFHIEDIKKLAVSHLKTVTDLRQLAVTFDHLNHPLIGYFESKPEEATETLAKITEWKKNEIELLLKRFFGDSPEPEYLRIRALLKLKTCFDLSHQLGAEPSTLLKKVWEKAWPDAGARQKEDMAKVLLGLLKAQTGEKERPALREALNQLINREKREALTGYVIQQLQTRDQNARPHIKTPRDLYDYLLIDVEMGEAASTSRLLEAISCLQLYLHRCRLHLEEGIVVGAGLEQGWPIMKSYRLWEAKQRILLYPENYIKPELRQDKTPLFKTLEDDLQQTDITDANVETAFKKYLDGFAEVAQLKIFGSHVYIDPAYPNDKMLILLGRSHTEPRKIYYRTARCLNNSSAIQWEPWEEIKLSIPAEQVYPVYAFGKIFIFWIELKLEKNPGDPNKPKYAHHAKLFYSFHHFNQDWSHPQQLGKTIQLQENETTEPPKEPEWARRLYPIYNAKTNQELYLFYQEVSADDKLITYKNVLKISPNLDLETFPEGSIPTSWIRNTLPKVLTQNPENYYPITNQPDWFIFQAKGGTFLLKPNDNKKPIGDAIKIDYVKHPIPRRISAVKISGAKSYIKIASSPKEFKDLSLTFEGWFMFNSETEANLIVSSPNAITSDESQYYLSASVSRAQVNCSCRIKDGFHFMHPIKPNQWVHLAVTRNNESQMIGYINGVMEPKRTSKELINDYPPLWLGFNKVGNSSILMSEVRIWNVTRSQAQIEGAMKKELLGNETGLIGYWRINEGTDKKINSFNERGVAGECHGNVTWVRFNIIAISSEVNYQPNDSTRYDIVRLTSNAVSTLSHKLLTGGMSSLLELPTQRTLELPEFTTTSPGENQIGYNANLVRTVPSSEHLGFDDADGIYYWEIFFHSPFLLAERLNTAQHFNQAQSWHNYIFNPTIKASPWQFLPLRRIKAQPGGKGILHNAQWKKIKHPFEPGEHEMLYFNGKDAYIDCGEDIDLKNKPFTIEFWAKRENEANKTYWIIGQGKKETHKEALHVCFNYRNINSHYFLFGFSENSTWSKVEYVDQNWHHWAVVHDKDKKEQRIYWDGKKVEKNNPELDYQCSGNLFIGKGAWGDFHFFGYIAEVRIWNYALGAEEIKQNSNKPCIGSEAGLIRYWPLERVNGNTVPNYATGADPKKNVVNDEAALVAFTENPFDPQSIAQIRPIAFKKAIGMRYIDTLIDHGDSLFRRYTYETIVEATLYYIMAFDLLGPQPVRQTSLLSQTKASNGSSPASLEQEILSFENGTNGDLNLLNQALDDPHFFLPENTHFLGYWDRVQDRLYKIRHSLNIDGVRQSLPLFQPSIDPATLLKRSANGLTDDSPLSSLVSAILPYRFITVLAKAQSLAAQVTQFGGALLSALEKKDAEALALLRNTQESALLKMTRSMKESQIEASKETVQSLTAGLAQASARQHYYTQLLEQGLSPAEITQIVTMSIAQVFNILSGITRTAAAIGHAIPQIDIMAGFTPNVITSYGGREIGGALSAHSSGLATIADQFNFAANMSSLIGGFERRAQEWELQKTLATHDITQIERQIESAKWQQKIAERDLEVLDKNIEQNAEIDSFLADKFTNRELYQWMAGKLTGIYFQSFQMAHDLALSAQRAFQFELTNNATFIDSAYWDGLKKGLLAGEILQVDLNRMEKAYLERNVRRFEIEKTVSLFELNPKALLDLKRTGVCDFDLTELIFSRDFPGHYSRQIKNISVSFPTVVGPYQNIYATLSQRVHRTLIEADIKGVKSLLGTDKDRPNTIRQDWRQNQQVALSRGLDDSGLFQLNFQDERYLPFEGTGAVSSWRLELNQNSINLNNLTDVIIKIEYTALTGDETFKKDVKDAIKDLPETKMHSRLFLIAQEFGDAWRQFLANTTPNKTLSLPMKKMMFPALTDPNSNLTAIYLQLELTEEGKKAVKDKPITLKVGDKDIVLNNFNAEGVATNKSEINLNPFQDVSWLFTDNHSFFTDKNVTNMALLAIYGKKTDALSNLKTRDEVSPVKRVLRRVPKKLAAQKLAPAKKSQRIKKRLTTKTTAKKKR